MESMELELSLKCDQELGTSKGTSTSEEVTPSNDLCRKLNYTVSKCSSYSPSYYPSNVLEDKPKDQSSRWSSDSNTPPQYLILKLQRVSIVKSITFGKFEKKHVCNIKKFKVFGGLSEDNVIEVLENGLKDDNSPESFSLKHKIDGHPLPCQYIKIVPLQSYGPSFNFSIWYVELKGIDEHEIVQPCIDRFIAYREREAIRVCLKHLRDHNHMDAFTSLQKKTKIQLEHPLMTDLYKNLVTHGDYFSAEQFLEKCAKSGLFHEYVSRQDYKAIWIPLGPEYPEVSCNDTPSHIRPGMRGGHQMCIDNAGETIYLFGGWDGNQDLSDFWAFNIPTGKWTMLSSSTELDGGPTARSCHKMCLDPLRRQIFTLGRYVDSQCRPPGRNVLKSDFYVYDIESNKWTMITDDTASMGGPELVFDHQMCMDEEKQTMYVFGGRMITDRVGLIESLNINLNAQAQMIAAMGMALNRNGNEDRNYVPPINRDNDNPPPVEAAAAVVADNLLAQMRDVGVQIFDGQNINVGRVQGRNARLEGHHVNLEAPIQRRGFPGGDGDGPGRVFELRRGAAAVAGDIEENPPVAAAAALPQAQQAANSGNGGNGGGASGGSPSSASAELLYSGLYAYHIPTNTWTLLRCDVAAAKPTKPTVRSRVGHSMLFHPGIRKLFIFAGQRTKEYLNDFFSYNVETDEIEIISDGQQKFCTSSPAAGFTQRATIDADLNEIYVFSGLSKDKEKRDDKENVQNSFWVFDIIRKTWSCIYRNDTGEISWSTQPSEPCPRFAHQLVYDHLTKTHYLFGGNPGKPKDPKLRLDDFWRLRLIRPSVEELLKQCKLLLRKQKFEELAGEDPLNALLYLQNSLSALIDHTDAEQTNEFQRLTFLLFTNEDDAESSQTLPLEDDLILQRSKEDEKVLKRSQLFDKLVHFFPENMTQPKVNLVDLLPFYIDN